MMSFLEGRSQFTSHELLKTSSLRTIRLEGLSEHHDRVKSKIHRWIQKKFKCSKLNGLDLYTVWAAGDSFGSTAVNSNRWNTFAVFKLVYIKFHMNKMLNFYLLVGWKLSLRNCIWESQRNVVVIVMHNIKNHELRTRIEIPNDFQSNNLSIQNWNEILTHNLIILR